MIQHHHHHKTNNRKLWFCHLGIYKLLNPFQRKMPTTIKAALKKWEEASGKKSAEAKEIKLIGEKSLLYLSIHCFTDIYWWEGDQTYWCPILTLLSNLLVSNFYQPRLQLSIHCFILLTSTDERKTIFKMINNKSNWELLEKASTRQLRS